MTSNWHCYYDVAVISEAFIWEKRRAFSDITRHFFLDFTQWKMKKKMKMKESFLANVFFSEKEIQANYIVIDNVFIL